MSAAILKRTNVNKAGTSFALNHATHNINPKRIVECFRKIFTSADVNFPKRYSFPYFFLHFIVENDKANAYSLSLADYKGPFIVCLCIIQFLIFTLECVDAWYFCYQSAREETFLKY